MRLSSVDIFGVSLFRCNISVELRYIILNYYYVTKISIHYLKRPSPYYPMIKVIDTNDANFPIIWSDVFSYNPKDVTTMINDFLMIYMVDTDMYAFELMLECSNIESDEDATKKFTKLLSSRRYFQVIDENDNYNKDCPRSNMLICPKKLRQLYNEKKHYYDTIHSYQEIRRWIW
jgi:hypothetical protein